MMAVSRPVSGIGSAAQRRPASGSAAIIFASSISASGLPAAWASTCSRGRPRGGCGCASRSRPASGRLSGASSSCGKSRSKPAGGTFPRAPTSSTSCSDSRRRAAKASASSEARSSHCASSAATSSGPSSDSAGKQGEHGDPGQQRVGRHGILGERESAAQRLGLPGRQASHAVQYRPQQLVQPGERQVLLRLPAGRRQYPHPRRPGLPRGLGQQGGLAHARIAQEQQHPAFLIRRGQQFPQPGQFLLPADQARPRRSSRKRHPHPAKYRQGQPGGGAGVQSRCGYPGGRPAVQGSGVEDVHGARRNAGS